MHPLTARALRRFVLVTALSVSGCAPSTPASKLTSDALPGTPILTFSNTTDRVGTTILFSNPGAQQAGVNGRALTISTLLDDAATDQLTLDVDGNVGLRGSYHSLSSKRYKKDIEPLRLDALGLLDRAEILQYHFRQETAQSPLHIGIIAENVPEPFTGPTRDSFNLNNSLAITMAATRELHGEVARLEARVESLEAELRDTLPRRQVSRP